MRRVLYILLFSSCVALSGARKCFFCVYNSWDSTGTNVCLDPFDEEAAAASEEISVVSCDGVCLKSKYIQNGRITTMKRTCVTNSALIEECLHGCMEYREIRQACTWCCQTDLCNRAGSVTPGHLLSACALLATVLIDRILRENVSLF